MQLQPTVERPARLCGLFIRTETVPSTLWWANRLANARPSVKLVTEITQSFGISLCRSGTNFLGCHASIWRPDKEFHWNPQGILGRLFPSNWLSFADGQRFGLAIVWYLIGSADNSPLSVHLTRLGARAKRHDNTMMADGSFDLLGC